MNEEENLPEAMYEGERYLWSCFDCMEVHYEESDCRGWVVNCLNCGKRQVVPS